MLFDPLEEKLHLPAAFVEGANRQCRQGRLIGQEDQLLAALWVLEPDTPQMLGIVLTGAVAIQGNSLIGDHTGGSVARSRIDAMCFEVGLGPRDEERTGLVQRMQSAKIHVAAIHDVDRTGLGY